METAADRLRLAIDMHDVGLRMYRQRMRREHPRATEAEIDARVQHWLTDRADSRFGDCPGRRSNRFA